MIAGIVMRKWFGERVLKKLPTHVTQQNAEQFLEALAVGSKLEMEVKTAKRTRLTEGEMVLASDLAQEKGSSALGGGGSFVWVGAFGAKSA